MEVGGERKGWKREQEAEGRVKNGRREDSEGGSGAGEGRKKKGKG